MITPWALQQRSFQDCTHIKELSQTLAWEFRQVFWLWGLILHVIKSAQVVLVFSGKDKPVSLLKKLCLDLKSCLPGIKNLNKVKGSKQAKWGKNELPVVMVFSLASEQWIMCYLPQRWHHFTKKCQSRTSLNAFICINTKRQNWMSVLLKLKIRWHKPFKEKT